MGIVDEDVVRVREASDMVAVVSEHVQLKRVGRAWSGLCPFHSEKSGSLSVSAEKGVYYCFGCGAKGDVITFVREIEHLDFVGAVEVLAAKAGITLRYSDKDEGEGRKQRARLIDAMAKAVEWYHQRLLDGGDAAKARGYLRKRGLGSEQVRAYQVGWAPEGWDELSRALKLPAEVLTGAGLGFINSRGRQTDAFRGRILFPIFDASGDPVGFGGRIMPGADGPKYKNTSETPIYAKSKVLYGLNWAKGAIVAADEAIVCEGYTDVIGFADAGLPRAVATCGTALTEEHFRTLKSFAHRVVLAFDADAAGQNAAARFYEWERAYEIDVAVAALPAGVDPADLARSDPGRAGRGGGRGHTVPRVPARPGARSGQPGHARGPGPGCRERGAGDRRAPQPAGARPVPDAGGVSLSGAHRAAPVRRLRVQRGRWRRTLELGARPRAAAGRRCRPWGQGGDGPVRVPNDPASGFARSRSPAPARHRPRPHRRAARRTALRRRGEPRGLPGRLGRPHPARGRGRHR